MIFISLSPKVFFVAQSDEANNFRRSLSNQIFQLSYFGKLDASFMSNLEVSERNYMYKLLKNQLDEEKKKNDEETKSVKSQTANMRSRTSSFRKR